jgi:hypothetical protein
VRLLREHGINQDPTQDLDTPTEKALGAIIKEKFHTDFYMLYRFVLFFLKKPKSYSSINKITTQIPNFCASILHNAGQR